MTTEQLPLPVKVKVLSFTKFFEETSFPIAMDTYQRGFVWSDEKVQQLVDDLADYQQVSKQPPYYMGPVLVHRNAKKQKCFIIDGQQRLTTLCLIHQQLNTCLPNNCELSYSPISARRIRGAFDKISNHPRLPEGDIFDRIALTVIDVERVDLAFIFFDTQNNRGVPLHATDLLKAYHLREVKGTTTDRQEVLQKLCAKGWEDIQHRKPVMSLEQEFAPTLFTKFLWRARYWTGRRVTYGSHDALMDEFQKRAWSAESAYDSIPLYRSRHNRLATALTLTQDGHRELHTKRILLSPKAMDLPFAIRQPVHKGVGFFLYSEKYAALLRWLVVAPNDSNEVLLFRSVYETLLRANSIYLREVFLLATLIYVDQFGDKKLWEFSLWLEHALGAIRLDKQQVRYEAAQNFFKNSILNLLDVIASGFRPEQVIDHLKTHHIHDDIYSRETIESGKRVQGIYKQAVLTYFGNISVGSLREKKMWIRAKLEEGNP